MQPSRQAIYLLPALHLFCCKPVIHPKKERSYVYDMRVRGECRLSPKVNALKPFSLPALLLYSTYTVLKINPYFYLDNNKRASATRPTKYRDNLLIGAGVHGTPCE
jgi:hypothetical protein